MTDPFAIKSMPLFSLESRHSLPFSENSIMRRFRFIDNSNVAAEIGNVQSGWDILVAELPLLVPRDTDLSIMVIKDMFLS